MASAQVENDFFTFCERNEDVFLVDHFPEKYAMKLSLARYDEEFLLIYDSNYPQSKFKVNLKGPHNEHTMKRANSIWELQPVIGINDALVQFLIIDKEERAYLKQLKEDPEQQKKRMREKFREQYNKIMANEKETQLNFNTQLSFQILTDDIIQVHLNKEKYGFDITAVNNNPFHWIVSFFNFNPTSAIFKDVQHLESLSSLDCVQMEFKFSVAMFPVFPPEYNFFAPKLTVQSLKDIFNSGAFEEECYNPFTKITLFKMIHNLIEKKGHIDFGKNGKQVLDYTNTDFFNEMQGCKPFLGRITHLGQEFIKNCKINGMPTKNSIQFNSFITRNCNAYKRFIKAKADVKFQSIEKSGFFCWHGSSDTAINSICKEGFDPSKRRGQAYGRGEYFGNTPEISMGYSKGNCHLILTYVLNSSKCKKINIGYVVDNPTKWDLSYCLPLLVITFNNGKPVDFLEKSLN